MNPSSSKWYVRAGVVVVAIAILLAAVLILTRREYETSLTVGIIEPLQHVAVSDITRGIREELAGRQDRMSIVVQNANGDDSAVLQIIAAYRDRDVDVYVPIFTKTTQAVKASVGAKAIVFAAVTDPLAAGLLNNVEQPEGNITGVSDLWPIGSQLELIKQILPNAKTIGIVYDPGDPSSAATMPLLRRESTRTGLSLELRPVSSTGEVLQSLNSLKGRADLLFTANDVTVTAAFPALVAFAMENNMPLFAGDYSSVQRGAIAAIGQSYYNVGRDAGQIVSMIVDGKPIRDIPVRYTSGGDVYLNTFAAEQMGVTVPQSVLDRAKEVYREIAGE